MASSPVQSPEHPCQRPLPLRLAALGPPHGLEAAVELLLVDVGRRRQPVRHLQPPLEPRPDVGVHPTEEDATQPARLRLLWLQCPGKRETRREPAAI